LEFDPIDSSVSGEVNGEVKGGKSEAIDVWLGAFAEPRLWFVK
jgi:hypothetical protein